MSTPTTPGRRRDLKHQPIFLRKTYHMISNCPPSIASWSDLGDSFVVKNTQDFAAKVIPCFFKHSNFSSFVRQLNFYGFRKVKAESILNTGNETKSWEFKHDKFIRGQPGLLSEIRRASGYAANSEPSIPQEVDELKAEVTSLRSQVELLTHTARDLTLLVNTFVRERNTAASGLPIDPLHELPMPSFDGVICDSDKRSCSPSSDSADHQDGNFSLTGRTSSGSTSSSASSSVAGGRGQRRLRSPRNPRPLAGAYASSTGNAAVAANGRQTGGRASGKLSLQKGGGGRRSAAASRSSSTSSTPSGASFLTHHSQAQQMYHHAHDPFSNGGTSSLTEGEEEDEDDEEEEEDEEFALMQGVAAVANAGNDLGGPTGGSSMVGMMTAVVPQQHARGVEMEVSIGSEGAADTAEGHLDDNQDFAESLRAFFPIDEDPAAEETARGFHNMLLKNFMDDQRDCGQEGMRDAQGQGGQEGLPHGGNGGSAAWGEGGVSLEDNVPMEVKMGAIFDNTPPAPPPPVVPSADLYSSDPPSGAGLVGANGAYLLPTYAATLPAMQPPQQVHHTMAAVDTGAMVGGSGVSPPARRKRKLTHEEGQATMLGEPDTEEVC